MARRLNEDHSDHSGSTTACACGQTARYAGRRPKTFTSVLGPLTLERAYYYCDACRAGICPRDRALGLHATSLSPGVLRMVGLAASDFSFAAASGLLWELAAVRVETKQVERAAEALGREVAADERDVAETVPSPAPTMYLGLDGTGVPVRPAEVEGRRGKQPDGSAKTREVKLATMWTAEGRDKAGRPVRDRGSVSYNAAVESAASRDTDPLPSAFAQRAYREAQRRGFDTAARRVVIGDGAPWIWQLAAEQFPGAIEIVDIYHAKQHLCDVAKTLYGPGTDLADQWARDRRAELDAGRLRAVVAELRIHVETTPEARRCIHYVFGNRHRMRYPQFRAKGLCISSGVVEAGCKQIRAKLKRALRHGWRRHGAERQGVSSWLVSCGTGTDRAGRLLVFQHQRRTGAPRKWLEIGSRANDENGTEVCRRRQRGVRCGSHAWWHNARNSWRTASARTWSYSRAPACHRRPRHAQAAAHRRRGPARADHAPLRTGVDGAHLEPAGRSFPRVRRSPVRPVVYSLRSPPRRTYGAASRR